MVVFGGGKGRRLSEYEASRIERGVPASLRIPTKSGYELVRTREFVVYRDNRRDRFRRELLIRRALGVVARTTGSTVEWDGRIARGGGVAYVFADRVGSKAEFEYHRSRVGEKTEVVALEKSPLVPWFVPDRAAFRNFYSKFEFPDWFRPRLKMRHFRFQLTDSRFAFQTRPYTASGKHGANEKFRHDLKVIGGGRVAKCYVSMARVLDPIKERAGLGRPVDLLMPVLDIDAPKDHEVHEIGGDALCTKCLEGARAGVETAVAGAGAPEHILFSGTKGFHLHYGEERSSSGVMALTDAANAEGARRGLGLIADDFSYVRDGERRFDLHRIVKVPGTADAQTACVVSKVSANLASRGRVETRDRFVWPGDEVGGKPLSV